MFSAVAVFALLRGHINQTTVALALLLVVLFIAMWLGRRPAIVASVVGMLSFNFFFLPPFGTFTIADPNNWVALTAFLITALVVGWLSASARRRAEEAERGRAEIKRLYDELREAFTRASHAEALRQSEQLKSALLDAVTHDIRTPLTSIKASVTTLLDEHKETTYNGEPVMLDVETRREMLEVIDEECDRLNRFIEDLIEMARIDAGEINLRRNWGAIDEIITAALARSEELTRGRKVVVDIEPELPLVRVDPRAVGEVVYALLDNAAKYTSSGSTIRLMARPVESDMVEVAVEDEGRGVPPALRERVFDKFFRASLDGDTGARQPSGTGMGLAIARGIVEAHGGRIRVEDAAGGRGARFVFTLPIGDDEDEAEQSTSGKALPVGAPFTPQT